MEGIKDLRNLLKRNDFMVKLDLQDAFWSVPIHQESKKFLRFRWEGTLYEFSVLAFGLGPAPRVFTKLMKVPMSILRGLNIRIIIYIDDMLIIASSLEDIVMARDTTIALLKSLGFTINKTKSCLIPLQCCEFLGMAWLISKYYLTFS